MPITNDFDIRNFIEKSETPNGTKLFDLTQNNPFDFEFDEFTEVKRVQQQDLRRMDKIANDKFSEPQFWWIMIYVANKFFKPSNLTVGDELQVPSGNDVFDFLERNRDT